MIPEFSGNTKVAPLSSTPTFTEEQYNKILQLLKKDPGEEVVNMAGTITCFISGNLEDGWIMDMGATSYMVFDENRKLITSISCLNSKHFVTLPNGSKVNVAKIGEVKISYKHTLKNVLFVPNFRYNLISISKLTKLFNKLLS